MATIYLTGGSGFLGHNLIPLLLKEEDMQIVCLVFEQEKNLEIFNNKKITTVVGNLLDKNSLDSFLNTNKSSRNIIIHMAGRISIYRHGDELTTKINYEGTKNLVDASLGKNIDKFIYISSVDSLDKKKGNSPIYEQEEYHLDKVDGVYSKSKVLANNYILEKTKEGLLNGVILCPSAILGPNDPSGAPINQVIKKFLNHKLPALAKGGYNMVDVRDVASGVIVSINKAKIGESYLLTGECIDIIDMVNLAADIKNRKHIKLIVPHFLIKCFYPFMWIFNKITGNNPLFTPFSLDCVYQNSNYQNKKANQEFGFANRNLKTTIIDTISWMEDSGYLSK